MSYHCHELLPYCLLDFGLLLVFFFTLASLSFGFLGRDNETSVIRVDTFSQEEEESEP